MKLKTRRWNKSMSRFFLEVRQHHNRRTNLKLALKVHISNFNQDMYHTYLILYAILVYMTFSDGLMVTDPNNLALVHLQNNDFGFAFRHLGLFNFSRSMHSGRVDANARKRRSSWTNACWTTIPAVNSRGEYLIKGEQLHFRFWASQFHDAEVEGKEEVQFKEPLSLP